MKLVRPRLVPLLFLFAACDGGDDVTPLPLVSFTGTVSAAGRNLVPTHGASNVLASGTVSVVFSDRPMGCATLTATEPPSDGTYVIVQVPSAAPGVASKHMVMFDVVSHGGDELGGGGSNAGTVEVLEASASAISLRISYQDTLSDGDYAIAADLGVTRCP